MRGKWKTAFQLTLAISWPCAPPPLLSGPSLLCLPRLHPAESCFHSQPGALRIPAPLGFPSPGGRKPSQLRPGSAGLPRRGWLNFGVLPFPELSDASLLPSPFSMQTPIPGGPRGCWCGLTCLRLPLFHVPFFLFVPKL